MSANGSRPSMQTAATNLDLLNPRAFEIATAVATSMLKGWGVMSEAWIGLWQSQIDSNLQLMQSLAKCDSPITALTLQLDGARATMTRCVSTATTTSDIASKVAAEALAPLRAAAQSAAHAA
jgi:hypothetical protein